MSWKSYQEDIDLTTSNGKLVNLPLPAQQWTVPLVSLSGVFGPGNFLNEYNNSTQYNYAPKHDPMVFFTDTNGGDNLSTSNPERFHYQPLQQLKYDLANNNVADYNWITPDQYNEMHSGLSAGFAGLTGDASNIRAGDKRHGGCPPSPRFLRHGWDEPPLAPAPPVTQNMLESSPAPPHPERLSSAAPPGISCKCLILRGKKFACPLPILSRKSLHLESRVVSPRRNRPGSQLFL